MPSSTDYELRSKAQEATFEVGNVMPAKAHDPAARAGEADGELRQARRGRAREKVAQMGFDGVGFGEDHESRDVG